MKHLALLTLLSVLLVCACNSSEKNGRGNTAAAAEAITTAECATCGMVVREQPAPRAQLVHRDGTRAYFCSIGDLLQYLLAPSQHGGAEAIFVEVMTPSEDPTNPDTHPHAWKPVEESTFVVGVERRGVMGSAVLSYATEADAAAAVERFGGKRRNFEQLRQSARRGSAQ